MAYEYDAELMEIVENCLLTKNNEVLRELLDHDDTVSTCMSTSCFCIVFVSASNFRFISSTSTNCFRIVTSMWLDVGCGILVLFFDTGSSSPESVISE